MSVALDLIVYFGDLERRHIDGFFSDHLLDKGFEGFWHFSSSILKLRLRACPSDDNVSLGFLKRC